jgi:hypothetical protein
LRKGLSILYNLAAKESCILNSISKRSFQYKEFADLTMLHSQLPPNLAPQPPKFEHCREPSSTFLTINDGGFGTPFMTEAFE